MPDPTPLTPEDFPDGHHPSCCVAIIWAAASSSFRACDTCINICPGYHGPERRSGDDRRARQSAPEAGLREAAWNAVRWLESGRTDQAEGDAATASHLRAALATPAPDTEAGLSEAERKARLATLRSTAPELLRRSAPSGETGLREAHRVASALLDAHHQRDNARAVVAALERDEAICPVCAPAPDTADRDRETRDAFWAEHRCSAWGADDLAETFCYLRDHLHLSRRPSCRASKTEAATVVAALSARRPNPTPDTEEPLEACEFAPAHEPWSCRVHHGIRTRLDVTVCSRIVPARLESEATATHFAWLRDGDRLARALHHRLPAATEACYPAASCTHHDDATRVLAALANPTTQEDPSHG